MYLQAVKNSNDAILVSLLDKGLIFIPIIYIAKYTYGYVGIAFSGFVTLIFSTIIAIALTIRFNKKKLENYEFE